MPGKSKHRKAKFQQQSKKKKTKRSPQLLMSQQEAPPAAEKVAAALPEARVEAPTVKVAVTTVEKPELVFELRRIGILGGVMLVALVILALVL